MIINQGEIITEMGLMMHRQSFVKESSGPEIYHIEMPDIEGYIDMSKIILIR